MQRYVGAQTEAKRKDLNTVATFGRRGNGLLWGPLLLEFAQLHVAAVTD